MQKIKLLTDSACDISPENEKELDIKILGFPVTVGDKGYIERENFTAKEFYSIMEQYEGIPVTSQITTYKFVETYKELFEQGYTDVINVTISSTGSNTYNSAVMAKTSFFEEVPEAKGKINFHIVDARNYSAVYGYPITQAAIKISKGATVNEILAYLDDWLGSSSLYFVPYDLKYAKKSGRLSAAAAFVGEMLGLKPIIRVTDGISYIDKKIRGEKNIIPSIVERVVADMVPQTPYIILKGDVEEYPEELAQALTKKLGYPPEQKIYIGASVATNGGIKVAGVVIKGKCHK